MKRSLGILLGLALFAGAGLAQAGRGGGGHGSGGGHAGGRPAGGGPQFTTGAPTHFTTGTPTRFTTGPIHFTGGHVHPGVRPVPPIAVRPGFPPHHRVIVGGAVVVAAPFFWYPAYPYPYYYPYAYVTPAYGGSYEPAPTYIEQGNLRYYCPDYQDYYPNVPTCPSPWMQVLPEPGAPVPN